MIKIERYFEFFEKEYANLEEEERQLHRKYDDLSERIYLAMGDILKDVNDLDSLIRALAVFQKIPFRNADNEKDAELVKFIESFLKRNFAIFYCRSSNGRLYFEVEKIRRVFFKDEEPWVDVDGKPDCFVKISLSKMILFDDVESKDLFFELHEN